MKKSTILQFYCGTYGDNDETGQLLSSLIAKNGPITLMPDLDLFPKKGNVIVYGLHDEGS
jgi:hypothetical protein